MKTSKQPTPALLLPMGIVALGTVIAFASSFAGAFVLDDLRTIVHNPRVHSLSHLPELITNSRRPVVDLSLAVSGSMAGPWGGAAPADPSAFHAMNLLIHLAAALALFDLIRRLAAKHLPAASAVWLACAAALLWAVHPLQTESVTYIIQRAESLAGMFYILTLWCVVRSAERSGKQAMQFALLAVLSSTLAMGSKGVAVTIPITALLMDRAFLSGSLIAALRQRWKLYAGLVASLLLLVLTGVAQGVLGAKANTGPATVGFLYDGISPSAYFLTQPAVILHYLRLTFVPVGQCLDAAWPATQSFSASLPTLIPMLALGGLTLWGLTKNTWWGFVGAWFFLILAPTSSFIPIKDLSFEHRMYLPLAAPLLLAIVSLAALSRRVIPSRAPRITALLSAAACVSLIIATTNRNAVYHSELRMWSDITTKAPHNARAWSNLGMTAARSTPPQLDLAERALRSAIAADPALAAPHVNLANVLRATNRNTEAIESYKSFEDMLLAGGRVIHKNQSLSIATAASSRGLLLVQTNRVEEAAEAFARAAEQDPTRPDHYVYLARTLAQLSRLEEAEAHITTALRLDPTSEPARRTLALIRQLRSDG